MATAASIVDTAQQILDDIRRRKLRPGDAYPSTADVARQLQVSGSTVNRALQLLAQRGVVERRQRQGTVVARTTAEAALRRVHLVVRRDHLRTEGLWADEMLLGLQGALPGVELQFNFRPEIDEADYVNQLIGEVLRSRQPAGFVLIRSTVVTQRLVAASGVPAVVSGMPMPSIRTLPSVDRDQRCIGELLAEHLLKRRTSRYVVLMRERMTSGDHAMLDGALGTFAAAGVKLGDVVLRCLPTDDEAIVAAVEELLDAVPRGKFGFLCRSEPLARGVAAAVRRQKLSERRRPTIVVADMARRLADDVAYACVEPTVSPEEWGAALGRTLATVAAGERPDPFHQIIPVRLRLPS